MKNKLLKAMLLSIGIYSLLSKSVVSSDVNTLPGFELGLLLIAFLCLGTIVVSIRKQENE